MQLFLFLNDLAGRFSWLDEGARFFYVGAVPLLAALFLGELLLVSRESHLAKFRIALSVVLALLLLAVIGLTIEGFARSWNLGTLSPRPWMTRRVNWLVIEPQDNSFPCYEVAIAAILATGMAFSHRKWGIAGAILTVLLALTRLFCGNNFLADVAIGAILGTGLCTACAAFCTAPHPFERASLRNWVAASAVVWISLGASYAAFAQKPRFATKLPLFWGSAATAATDSLDPGRKATRAARAAIGEGEGLVESTALHGALHGGFGEAASEPSAEELALSKRSHLFLPEVEKFLRGQLAPRARPFALLDVEVAPVKAGNSTYRSAAIRFEISQKVPDLRRQTAQIAAALTKSAFENDADLQNVDITAILRGEGTQIDGSQVRFAGDEVPVFTASIARQSLIVASPRWANDPKLDAGLWLRTRSRLFINDKILPAAPRPKPTSAPLPTPTATPAVPLPIPTRLPSTPLKTNIKPTATPKLSIPKTIVVPRTSPKPLTTPVQTLKPFNGRSQ